MARAADVNRMELKVRHEPGTAKASLEKPSKFAAEVADRAVVTNQITSGKSAAPKNLFAGFAAVGIVCNSFFGLLACARALFATASGWRRSATLVSVGSGGSGMWKSRKEDEIPAATPSVLNSQEVRPVETPKPVNEFRAEVAHIGKSVLVKGELSGSEDLYLDGEVEGSVELRGHNLTVGPNGRVRAHIRAKEVMVHGKVDGNVNADRVELKKSAIHVGNIVTQRVIIEEGAFFKGSIDVQREQKAEPKPAVTVTAVSSSPAAPTSAPAGQASLLEPKR
jgi:cytoskeletal protein CcmA (bactofilin family)